MQTNPNPIREATQSMQRKRTVLIIEDDLANREMMESILCERFDILQAADGEEGVRVARQGLPDVILLDLGIPKVDGFRVCEDLRKSESTRHIPVIMVTGSDDVEKRVAAFSMGADDFIAKPFRATELVARIQSKVRRLEEAGGTADMMRCGNLSLYLQRFEASINDQAITLSVLEFNLLKYFVKNPNRVISRDELLDTVWGDAVVGERTVDTHMVSLRKRLVGFDHTIATVYSAGYILKKGERNPARTN